MSQYSNEPKHSKISEWNSIEIPMKNILLENGYVPILFVVTVFYIKETKKAKFENLYRRNF